MPRPKVVAAAVSATAIPAVAFQIAQLFRRKQLEYMRARHDALLKLCEKIQAAPVASDAAERASDAAERPIKKARTGCHSGRSVTYP